MGKWLRFKSRVINQRNLGTNYRGKLIIVHKSRFEDPVYYSVKKKNIVNVKYFKNSFLEKFFPGGWTVYKYNSRFEYIYGYRDAKLNLSTEQLEALD